jgi:hypothetical protein
MVGEEQQGGGGARQHVRSAALRHEGSHGCGGDARAEEAGGAIEATPGTVSRRRTCVLWSHQRGLRTTGWTRSTTRDG